MAETKKKTCMLCGKPSEGSICAACAERLRGEALEKKKKDEKVKP